MAGYDMVDAGGRFSPHIDAADSQRDACTVHMPQWHRRDLVEVAIHALTHAVRLGRANRQQDAGIGGGRIHHERKQADRVHDPVTARTRRIGAVLLDKADPSKILARSSEPLVRPEPSDREGYVPNVVYTCGAMRHNDRIILSYAISDTFCSVATMKIAALLDNLRQ